MSFRFRVRACGHRQVSSKFITGEFCVFALIDGGDESYITDVATDVGHFLWSQLAQLRIWFARNAVPAL